MKSILIFTDGAAKGNPGPGGWGAVLLFSDKIKEIGARKADTTNNEMELRAVVEALKEIPKGDKKIEIYSDSKYVVDGATGWVFGWIKNGWQTKNKTDVLHKELWEELLEAMKGKNIEWHKIPGHVDLAGNDCADKIASGFGDGKDMILYDGRADKYTHDITDTSFDEEEAERRSEARKRQAAKAFSYVSIVDGEIQTHETWAECEERVRGTEGARYRKALTEEEEQEIIKEFESLK
jgi:ribonuclease HI